MAAKKPAKKTTKHTWNHRLLIYKNYEGHGEHGVAIHEVHYEDGKPIAYGMTPHVHGASVDEVRVTLERMLACLGNPILDPDTDFGRKKRTSKKAKK